MSKTHAICSLDIGSSKVVATLSAHDASGILKVLSAAQVPCQGLRGGVVVSIPETAKAIAQAIELCEDKAQMPDLAPVTEVILGIRGNHLQSFNNKGAYNIARTDKEITSVDVESVLEIAQAVPLSQDREVLHAIPQDFWVDRQKGVPNPVGMEGSLLEVDVHILTAVSSHLNNISKAVNQAGFRVSQIVYGLLALGECVVTPEEKEQGCLLIDFGGQTLALGVFCEGSLRYSREIALGSDALTRDLAYALGTSITDANRLKENHCACLTSLVNPDEEVEYKGIGGREVRKARVRTIVETVQPRVEEIFGLISKELETGGWLEVIVPGGVILTGGGSLMKGLTEATTELMNVPARMGFPQSEDIATDPEVISNPSYATALALIQYTQRPPLWEGGQSLAKQRSGFDAGGLGRKVRGGGPGWSRKVRGFIEELLS